uniref:Immunoglobulin V-set domain-containing protein n=1 Tax=Myotis lucifugus TaxID=59463 RepID=G1QCP0_MYOLU
MTLVFTLALGLHLFLRTGTQSVTQPDSHITVSEPSGAEGQAFFFFFTLFWYVQYPNQGLQILLKYTSGNSLVSGIQGFKAEFRKNETSFHLRKLSAHWSDSAVYFCALSGT